MKAADSLEGLTLRNGWRITSKMLRPPQATGGFFSVGYKIENAQGRQGFLKAFDFDRALSAPDPVRELSKLTNNYIWERDLLIKCRDQKMRRVATAVDHGTVEAPGFQGIGSLVYYLIFEWAEGGDLRQKLISLQQVDLHMALMSLKHAALGLQQLHRGNIFHQDLKPSNVLLFSPLEFKVADLGRSTDATAPAEHDDFPVPGDVSHAPLEQLYRYGWPWNSEQRKAADLYQLGSLIFFNFTGLTARNWIHKIATESSIKLGGCVFEEDLDSMKAVFAKTLTELSLAMEFIPESSRSILVQMARELCEPNPKERGSIKHKSSGTQYNVERYASRLALLVKRSEIGML